MAPAWRPAEVRDVAGIAAVAAATHPAHPERDAVFAERLRLFPEGCRVLGGDVHGYLLSHPWRFGRPPALDTLLGGLPARPDTYYVHDLALLPGLRRQGHAAAAVRHMIRLARRLALPTLSLVAVNGTDAFWRRFGFAPHENPALAAKLAGYGDAAYMVLDLGST
jgi:GNAT superfamily N-acetyltransferase